MNMIKFSNLFLKFSCKLKETSQRIPPPTNNERRPKPALVSELVKVLYAAINKKRKYRGKPVGKTSFPFLITTVKTKRKLINNPCIAKDSILKSPKAPISKSTAIPGIINKSALLLIASSIFQIIAVLKFFG